MSHLSEVSRIIGQVETRSDSAMIKDIMALFPKFEQIAFYTSDIEATKLAYRALGCTEWTDDIVTARGTVESSAAVNVLSLIHI